MAGRKPGQGNETLAEDPDRAAGWPDEIVAALREGWIGNDAALEWAAIKLGLDKAPGEFDHLWPGGVQASARRPRPAPRHFRTAGTQVHAHSNSDVVRQVTQAVEDALTSPAADEFAGLFPPSAPLGHEVEPKTSLIYTGESQGRRMREAVSSDGYVNASDAPLSDEELHHRLFGDHKFEPGGH